MFGQTLATAGVHEWSYVLQNGDVRAAVGIPVPTRRVVVCRVAVWFVLPAVEILQRLSIRRTFCVARLRLG